MTPTTRTSAQTSWPGRFLCCSTAGGSAIANSTMRSRAPVPAGDVLAAIPIVRSSFSRSSALGGKVLACSARHCDAAARRGDELAATGRRGSSSLAPGPSGRSGHRLRVQRHATEARGVLLAGGRGTSGLTTGIQPVVKPDVEACTVLSKQTTTQGHLVLEARERDSLGRQRRRFAPSTGRAAGWSGPAALGLMLGPLRDLGAQPKLCAAAAETDDRAGHVRVAPLVLAHCVAMRKAEDLGDAVCVNEVVRIDPGRHVHQPTSVGGSVRGTR